MYSAPTSLGGQFDRVGHAGAGVGDRDIDTSEMRRSPSMGQSTERYCTLLALGICSGAIAPCGELVHQTPQFINVFCRDITGTDVLAQAD